MQIFWRSVAPKPRPPCSSQWLLGFSRDTVMSPANSCGHWRPHVGGGGAWPCQQRIRIVWPHRGHIGYDSAFLIRGANKKQMNFYLILVLDFRKCCLGQKVWDNLSLSRRLMAMCLVLVTSFSQMTQGWAEKGQWGLTPQLYCRLPY